MSFHEIPVPHLTTAYSGPLSLLEEKILKQVPEIEAWFRQQWQMYIPPITSSVDLRNAGFKLAPVDTNVYPAGFNNLNPDFLPLGIQAIQSVLMNHYPQCTKIMLLPESHTRNPYYIKSLGRLYDMLSKAGYVVRIGSLDPEVVQPRELVLDTGEQLCIDPLVRIGNRLCLADFDPCLLILNNDLSTGVPDILKGIEQTIQPPPMLGWGTRLKSSHFKFYSQVAVLFSELVGISPWLISPLSEAVDDIDFMSGQGLERIAQVVHDMLTEIQRQYKELNINERPFVVVKSDNGTYGMGVMMVHDAEEVLHLNRRQRKKMASNKGSQPVKRVLVQEGVPSFETMDDGSVAEPVVYMLGQYVIGGFYRVHQGRGRDENLNAPGMHFEPLAFAKACNMPKAHRGATEEPNRFYTYGVIARLAALAAAHEMGGVR
jgi:glutamate--cysteine ligase